MYKPQAYGTLMRLTKKELIECVRIAEHNANVFEQTLNQQAKNMENWEPVVKCKDCKHAVDEILGWACDLEPSYNCGDYRLHHDDFFCKDGAPKERGL